LELRKVRRIVGQLRFAATILSLWGTIRLHCSVHGELREMSFDRIDRQILSLLQADGRMTNVDLADQVGLTAPPCLRRVRALEEAGAIRGYHADLDASRLGFPITVFAMVSLRSQAEHDLAAFEHHIADIPEIRECHMLNGEIDFILKIVAADLKSFQEILTTHLTPAPNVASVKTSLTIRTAKALSGIPVVVD
jgi:DNA-binding Lrp family transcriptional regulator